jgi:hypothetical protein
MDQVALRLPNLLLLTTDASIKIPYGGSARGMTQSDEVKTLLSDAVAKSRRF